MQTTTTDHEATVADLARTRATLHALIAQVGDLVADDRDLADFLTTLEVVDIYLLQRETAHYRAMQRALGSRH